MMLFVIIKCEIFPKSSKKIKLCRFSGNFGKLLLISLMLNVAMRALRTYLIIYKVSKNIDMIGPILY